MGCGAYQTAIADLLDGSLDREGQASLVHHLETCPECSAVVRDLQQIKRAAGMLSAPEPSPSVWTRVAGALDAARGDQNRRTERRRLLAVAATVLLVVGAGALYRTQSERTVNEAPAATTVASPDATGTIDGASLVQSIEEELRLAEQHYERAIAGLEQAAQVDQKALDPQLAATLQKTLGVIDQAIEESRAAVRAQPASHPARDSLFEAFKSKVSLLQDTIALINEMRKGDDAGTARVMSQLAK